MFPLSFYKTRSQLEAERLRCQQWIEKLQPDSFLIYGYVRQIEEIDKRLAALPEGEPPTDDNFPDYGQPAK